MDLKPIDLTLILVIAFSVVTPVVCVCETGWYEYYDTCFFISGSRYNKNDLKKFCAARNASLWTVHNETERQWVMKIIEQGPRILYWLDLELINRRWTWIDRSVTYNKNNAHWYQNKEGSVTSNNKCAAMLSYKPYLGQLQQKRCADGWGTICTRPKDMLDFCDISNGWHYVDGWCLKFFSTPKTWQDARRTCQDNQGDLTIYKSYLELTNLYNLVPCRTNDNIAWIGLSDTVQPRTWRWVNNDTVRYSRWYPYGNRILTNGSTCAATDPINSWQWRNYQCDYQHPFICNRSLGVCPSGWLSFKDRCYQPNVVPSSQKTWFDAKTYCEAMGTELLIINSDDEQQFINQTINTLKVTQAWLGFSDMDQSDVLTWLNGKQVTDSTLYQRWDKNFPRPNPKRFDCGLLGGSRDSRWSNGYCYNFNSFFCEMIVTLRPLSPTPSPATSHCDTGWQLYRNKCYYFGPAPGQSLKTWGDARDYCQSAMGNLIILDDPYEISYVTVQQAKDKTSWIGLKYDSRARQLMWVDGSSPGQKSIKETNFYPGEPDDINNGQLCIQIVGGRHDYTGSWDDGNCTVPKAFICEKDGYPGSSQLPTTPPVPNSWSVFCGPQWVYDSSENYCYQVVLNNPSTWSAARADCMARGGDLLSISGRTEQNFVQAMLSTGQYASIQVNFWIGATDQSQEGGWKWTDNSPFRYLNWHVGEPNNWLTGTVPEDCAEMVPAWNYQWNDKFCAKEQLYICKKIALVTSQPTLTPPTGAAAMTNCPGVPMMSGNYSLVATSAFGASSSRDTQHAAGSCRWYQGSAGAWSAKVMDTNQYISARFFNTIVVKGFITAGRTDTDEWVTNYSIKFKENYYADWLDYMDPPGTVKIFTGNVDAQNPVTNMLLFPFEAKIIRLIPTKWQSGISVRMEILGCIEESCTPDYAISGPLVIPDKNIKASSTYDISHDKNAARLKPVTPGVVPACWKPITNDMNQWISADLGSPMIIRGVTIKGNPNDQQWVTQYRFQYSLAADGSSYQYYQEPYLMPKTIPGNTDNTSPSTYMFKSHFQARFVKILPRAWNGDIALSFDVLVCPNSCETIPLVTGSIPIPDDSFRASSMVDSRHSAFRARLNQPSSGGYSGAWRPLFNDKNQFIQVDLGYSVQVAAVATQGSFDSQDYIKTFQLSYSNDGQSWTYYYELDPSPKVFTANWDNKSVRKSFMLIPFIARYLRLWPQTWNNNIAVRLEYYGCPGPDSGTKIGCFADNSHQRDLPYEPYTDPRVGMWPPMCINHCFRKGYYYAGVQAQFKCFCGNSYGRYGPATDCNMSCVPKKNFICGGPSSSVIYTTGLSSQFKVCPSQWKSYKDKCYLLLLDQKTWLRARADCKILGGDLASPNSQQEQDFVYSLVQFTNGTNVWLGFNDRQDNNVYQWVDGRQVMYTNWGLNQPSQSIDQDCVLMQANSSGSWSSAACESSSRYVCQVDKRPSIEPSMTVPIQGCPSGWDAYRWSCYLYADATRSWSNAHTACQAFGANLVNIIDRYEQAYLSSVLGSRSGEYWTDVSDTQVPGTFQYADLNVGLPYTNWAQNKPDATSQCVSMGSGRYAGLWYNHNCTDLKGMVCKQPRIGFTTPAIPPAPTVLTPCDNGTIQTSKYCYQVNVRQRNLRLSWQEALDNCMAQGGNLASFHSAADIDTVWRKGLVGISGGFWIGLNDRDTENGYKWSDKSVGDVFNWDQGQPDNYRGAEDCIEVNPQTSKWNDNFCQLGRNWICMVKRGSHFAAPPTVNAPTAGPSTKCGASGNWSSYNNMCYFVSDGQGNQGRSWRQARDFCQQNGGDLASISSAQEQKFVYLTLMKNVTAFWLWLGFSELDSTQGYRWSDGSPTTFTNWDMNEPNDYGGQEDCVVMLIRDGKWLDLQCSSKAGFVCKKQLGATKPTAVVPTQPWPGHCPTGFNPLYNRCYKIFTTAVNWTTALDNCHKLGHGYSLASVRNGVENAFLTTQMADMRASPWIGLNKDYRNQLRWIDNDDVTYTNFAYGQPDGQRKEKCIQMLVYTNKAGQWNDKACSSLQGYICQTVKSTQIPTQEPVPSLCDVKQKQTQFLNNCYFFIKTTQTWNSSNNNCMKTGAYLTSINSAFEQSFIYLLKSQNNAGPVWIGLNDRQSPGIYSWSDSWPVQYTNWDAGQPVQGPSGGCIMFNGTGRWSVTDCSTNLPSICKISRAVPSLTPPPPNGSCDLGWYSYINKCYYMGANQPATVLDATLFCQQQQATLVSIHNQTVNQYLVRTLSSLSSQSTSFWTSLHKSLNSGFQWIDGSPVQYTNWRSGEPSTRGWSGNDENCAEVFLNDGKWNDEDCNSKRAFICEKQQATDILGTLSSVPTTALLPQPHELNPVTKQPVTFPPPSNAQTLVTTLPSWFTSTTSAPSTTKVTTTSSWTRTTVSKSGPKLQTGTTAVDNAVSGAFNVPTPIPRTPPINLPSQVVPTLPSKSSGNPPPNWSVLTTPPTPGVLQSGSSVLPTIKVFPYTGKSTQQEQGGTTVTKTVLGMSPGGLAGVIIGAVLVILLAILVLMYWRRRTTQGQQARLGLEQTSFENKTYSYNKEREEVTDNGADSGGQFPLRTMSESSS